MTIEISDEVRSLFHARLEHTDGRYVLDVPDSEVETGALADGEVYRVVLTSGPVAGSHSTDAAASTADQPPGDDHGDDRTGDRDRGRSRGRGDDPSPPVSEGDRLAVVIEDQGDEGDGIARVGPGFIVFVPETDPGDRVRIEITDVTGSYAFGDVVERISPTS